MQTLYSNDTLRDERLRAVEAMANSLLHDLRNPLSVARCCTDLIATETKSSEMRELAALLDGAVKDIGTTTQELLDYAGGSISLKKRRVPLSRLLDELSEQSLRLLPEKHIALVKEIRYDGRVDVDLPRFVRALCQLIKRACGAMPAGGVLRMTADLVQNEIAIRITDNGEALLPELAPNLFQPFETDLASTCPTLGLAVAKAVVEAHAGRISISSVPNKGTTVDIRLPAPAED